VLPDAPVVHYAKSDKVEVVLGKKYSHSMTQIWHNLSFVPYPIVNIAGVQPNGLYAQVTSCKTVGKSLPKGLTLAADCTLGGIAKEMSWPPERFIIEASNCGGSGTTSISLGVRAIPPTVTTYTGGKCARWVVGNPIAASFNLIDRDTDPIIVTTVVPALPAGVTLNTTDGTVHGTPTEVRREMNYTFTVSNSGGSTSFTQLIEVLGSPPMPWKYQTIGLVRAKEQCSLKNSDALKSDLYTCNVAKSVAQGKNTNLEVAKAAAEKALKDSTTKVTTFKAESIKHLEMLAANSLKIGNLTVDVATLQGKLAFMDRVADNRTLLVKVQPRDTTADRPAEAEIAVWDTITNTLAENYTGVVIVSLSENENRNAGQYFPVLNGLVKIKFKGISKTGTYKLHASTGDAWPSTIHTMTNTFKVSPGAAAKIQFVKQPEKIMDANRTDYSVTANVSDFVGNLQTGNGITGTLTIPGNNFTKTATFSNGLARFTNLELPAGKHWRMMLTTNVGSNTLRTMSDEFKVTVAPAVFSHSLTGMDSATWSDTRTQTTYKTAMASNMGDSVSVDDITITSVTFTTRRSAGATVGSSVALTNAAEARNAVASLEQATGTSNFVDAMKSAAATLGVTLPASLASAPVTGTSSEGMTLPAKYANADKSGSSHTVTVNSSSSSSGEKAWRITAIAFMAAFGIALVGVIAFSVHSWKNKSRPQKHVMGSTLGMTAEGGMTPGSSQVHKNALIEMEDSSAQDDVNAVADIQGVETRERSSSSTTHKVDLGGVYNGDDIQEAQI
jgi:hypothetical protein